MKPLRRLTAIFSFALLIATAALMLARHNTIPSPRIVFSVYPDYSSQHVYWASLDGDAPPHRITTRPIEGSVFAISPDRRWLFFEQTHVRGLSIFRLRIADNHIDQLSPDAVRPTYTWTPDQEWLIFQNAFQIFRVHIDSHAIISIVEGFNRPTFEAFSPDGEWLIFSATVDDRFSNIALYRVRLDGSDLQLVSTPIANIATSGFGYEDHVWGWLDDGGWMIVERKLGGVGTYLVRMPLNGGEAHMLTPTFGYQVLWKSDDSETLIVEKWVFNRQIDEIYRLDVDTRALTFIGTTDNRVFPLFVSPEGQHIVFPFRDVADYNLFLFDTHDGSVHQLTHGPNNDVDPHWSPDSQWIVFTQVIDHAVGTSNFPKLYQMRVDGSDLQPLTTFTDQFEEFNLWLPAIDLEWHPTRLILVSIIAIGLATLKPKWRRRPSAATPTE